MVYLLNMVIFHGKLLNQMVNTGHRSEEFSTCRMFVAISFNILQRSSTFLLQRKRFMRCSLPNRSHSSCGLADLLSSVTGPRKKVVENGEVRSWAKGFLWIARIFYAVKEEEEEEEVLVSPCFTMICVILAPPHFKKHPICFWGGGRGRSPGAVLSQLPLVPMDRFRKQNAGNRVVFIVNFNHIIISFHHFFKPRDRI